MITYKDFSPEAMQVSAFVANGELSTQRVLRYALRGWGEEYDGDPIALPQSEEFPPEIPAVVLSSKDGRQRLEASRGRVNLIRIRIDEATWDSSRVGVELANRVSEIFDAEQATIGRLGVVLTSLADADDPASQTAQHFLRSQFAERFRQVPEDIQLGVQYIIDLEDGLPVNSWTRIRSAKRLPGLTSVIAVEQDINSMENERGERQFPPDAVRRFIERVILDFSSGLSFYYPVDAPGGI